ncbi:hypothetical protein ACH4A8_04920 [Streptomyces vietnamensis]|uniref:hypothetical protein n=1 Tax=Streptomyces vietnamensis TaxID=362257 RepID=UPI0037A061A3
MTARTPAAARAPVDQGNRPVAVSRPSRAALSNAASLRAVTSSSAFVQAPKWALDLSGSHLMPKAIASRSLCRATGDRIVRSSRWYAA